MKEAAFFMRRLVAVFHVALALGLCVDGLWVLQQGGVNALWEHHFYGLPSEHTGALLFFAVMALGIAVVQILSSAVYAAGLDGGGTALLVASIVLTCILQPPLQWAVIVVGLLILLESILQRIGEEPAVG